MIYSNQCKHGNLVTAQAEVFKISQNGAISGWAPATPAAQSVIGIIQRTLYVTGARQGRAMIFLT